MAHTKKKLLLISFTDLLNDPRPFKAIEALKGSFNITELALGPSKNPYYFEKIINISKASLFQKIAWLPHMLCGNIHPYLQRYVCNEAQILKQHYDLIFVEDICPAPLAFKIARGTPIILDLQEYLPREYEDNLYWRLFFQKGIYHLCQEYIPKASACITVSQQIAEEYKKNFSVEPEVIYNTPLFIDVSPKKPEARCIKMVHHGSCAPGRSLENMLSLMDRLDSRFELHLYLVGSGKYYTYFKKKALSCPRVYWHPPVPMPDIPKEISQYDIGLFMLPANTFNHDNTIANKLFEFIQARLLTAVWPTKGMKTIIDAYHTGFYTEDFSIDEMSKKLRSLDIETIYMYKKNSHSAAHILKGEYALKKIQAVVSRVLEHKR